MAPLVGVVVSALVVYGVAGAGAFVVLVSMLWAQLKSLDRSIFTTRRRDAPPQCLRDKELGQHGYVTVKGLKFHYVEKGDKTKPLMLLVHGFPEFWYSWRHQIKEFSKDYWTVAIDMRGYGDSDKPSRISDYYNNLLVEDIKGIVTELGRRKFILVAHDWGSVLGWLFVDKYPEMVDKYVLMNGPHPDVYFKLMTKSLAQALKSWYVFFFQVPFLPEMYMRLKDYALFSKAFLAPKKSSPYTTNDDIEAFKYTFSRPGALTPPINFYRAALRKRILEGFKLKSDKKVQSRGTRPPGLYIFGAKDIAIDIRNVDMHKDTFECLQTVIISEGNHFIQQDEPEAVNKAMHSFLK